MQCIVHALQKAEVTYTHAVILKWIEAAVRLLCEALSEAAKRLFELELRKEDAEVAQRARDLVNLCAGTVPVGFSLWK